MAELEVGTRVSFTRAQDRQNVLTGIITEVRDDEVLVLVDPHSMPVWATTADVAVILEVKVGEEKKQEEIKPDEAAQNSAPQS